jgi:hypothetical protein
MNRLNRESIILFVLKEDDYYILSYENAISIYYDYEIRNFIGIDYYKYLNVAREYGSITIDDEVWHNKVIFKNEEDATKFLQWIESQMVLHALLK